MIRKWGLSIVFVVTVVFIAVNCSNNNGSPTQPIPIHVIGSQLTAVPASALVGAGTSENVVVSGGIPPYSISSPPSSIADVQLLSPDSAVAILQISGVTVASVSTAVTIRDSAAAKTVTIPITVH